MARARRPAVATADSLPPDSVTRGQPIAQVETDKVVIDMESLATGTLVEIVCDADEAIIQVGEILGYLEDRPEAS